MDTDRCDRYGAAGKTRYTKDGNDLVFCGHHDREYGLDLLQSDFEFDALFTGELVNA